MIVTGRVAVDRSWAGDETIPPPNGSPSSTSVAILTTPPFWGADCQGPSPGSEIDGDKTLDPMPSEGARSITVTLQDPIEPLELVFPGVIGFHSGWAASPIRRCRSESLNSRTVAAAKSTGSCATKKSLPCFASTPPAAAEQATTGKLIAIASSSLFWMPLAIRNGTTATLARDR